MNEFESATLFIKSVEISIGVIVALLIAILGFAFNKRLKVIEGSQDRNNVLLQKRIELYDELKDDLNLIQNGAMCVGRWASVEPSEFIQAKRRCDAGLFSNLPFVSDTFLVAYDEFMDVCFETWRGIGKQAVFRANLCDHKSMRTDSWKLEWDQFFMPAGERANWVAERMPQGKAEVSFSQDLVLPAFASLMEAVSTDIGSGLSAAKVNSVLARPTK